MLGRGVVLRVERKSWPSENLVLVRRTVAEATQT